ncbi:MBL fold metallo-hydrolase [Desulfopila aestuarii]|uniref:Metallo-beta-lactamase superfamily protein n=1 Tax=Desulfopila aestuarii DSM 18488 TaxID=1121416 RepID=A0A1M7XYJ4_9BACT|nr:MBL fold metallo-hydrolase [Desulfopila aestuarii]SHO44130.1 Metallo-beta-lactamase superfamily protein [Desulfopila aestuarii DSM 18488]
MKRKVLNFLAVSLCLSWGISMPAVAQDPAKIWLRQGPNKLMDTPVVMEQMDIARDLAGDDPYFLTTQRLQCNDIDDTYTIVGPPGFNGSFTGAPPAWKEVPAVPTQVFDNVYYVGGMEVGGWLIDTGDGYIMLDSSYDYGVEEILLPNMEKLGLDPAQVKYIMITHGSIGRGGGDHAGGVKYFNETYGTKIVLSGPEWAKSDQTSIDHDDVIVPTDGQTLTLGDTTVTMVNTPRSVGGGGLSYFIPVKIKGKQHLWATYGNTGINSPLANIEVYLASMEKWFTYLDNLEPDIAISSHPFVDGSLDRMALIRECNDRSGNKNKWKGHGGWQNQECQRNPFLIGKEGARRYFEIMDQCAYVRYMREAAGISNTGLACLNGLDADGNCLPLP